MILPLVLDYPVRDPTELLQFLDPAEIDDLNAVVVAAVGELPPGDLRVPGVVRTARLTWLEPRAPVLRGRITEFILRRAVDLKYADRMPRRDGRLWSEIEDRLAEHPAALDLSPAEAVWLTGVVAGDVLDRFAPAVQRFLAVFEAALERLRAEVTAK